jgi:hypothetical protein
VGRRWSLVRSLAWVWVWVSVSVCVLCKDVVWFGGDDGLENKTRYDGEMGLSLKG